MQQNGAAEPRDVVAGLERAPRLPDGEELRFHGYGVMGLPLASGHVLALRRFPASSIGPAYTSVWHRDPLGRWTFYVDVAPELSCAHFFGAAITAAVVDRITVTWTGPRTFTVVVDRAGLAWAVHLRTSTWSRLLNSTAQAFPDTLWRSGRALAALGTVAGRALDLGQLRLSGQTPNGHRFRVAPRCVWLVEASTALLRGEPLGRPDGACPQSHLGDFWIPRRGVFAVGQAYFGGARSDE
jgi:hypothetical protein